MSTVSAGVLPAGTSEERISYLLGAIATVLQQLTEKPLHFCKGFSSLN
jgi:hypothetical protein